MARIVTSGKSEGAAAHPPDTEQLHRPNPQPRLSHPRHRPPAPASGLGRALQQNARDHRNPRRNAAIHRRGIQGIGLDLRWNHAGAPPIRSGQALRQAPEGCLAPATAKRLETHPQSLESAGSDKPVTGWRNIYELGGRAVVVRSSGRRIKSEPKPARWSSCDEGRCRCSWATDQTRGGRWRCSSEVS